MPPQFDLYVLIFSNTIPPNPQLVVQQALKKYFKELSIHLRLYSGAINISTLN